MNNEHLECADTVKGMHRQLREKAATLGPEEAWNQHLTQSEQRKHYASTMHRLAMLWEAPSRISWVVDRAREYFREELLLHWRQREQDLAARLNLPTISDFPQTTSTPKTLDVGSCYNPYSSCDFMDLTPIDLTPAVPNVLTCDFLNVSVSNKTDIDNKTVKQFEMQSFDMIIFSLFLEYLPSPDMRSKCCKKAYELLKGEGILVIVTPDSKNVGANAKIYKNWRYALALMGFTRIKYEKLTYLHCMVFRKSIYVELPIRWAMLHKELYMNEDINIPQDFQVLSTNKSSEIITYDSEEVSDLFVNLPIEVDL